MIAQLLDKVMTCKTVINLKMKIFIFQNLVNVYIISFATISTKNKLKRINNKY